MSMSYSDHVCTNFQPKDADSWDSELFEHLCKEINKLQDENQELRNCLSNLAKTLKEIHL